MRYVIPLIFALGLAACGDSNDATDKTSQTPNVAAATGSAGLSTCVACHGANGEGNKGLSAPAIANLEDWYVVRQLTNFRDDIRGTGSDHQGAQMKAIVANLSDQDIQSLAQQVADLPDVTSTDTSGGDPLAGKNYYYHQCGACHGPGARGNKTLGAPRLAGLDDWYINSQLNKFAEGIRGNHAQDHYGSQMVFMMGKLTHKDQLRDITAFLRDPSVAE
ncbi:MAG: c-type cytochrome [Pseudomonadales bacterium]